MTNYHKHYSYSPDKVISFVQNNSNHEEQLEYFNLFIHSIRNNSFKQNSQLKSFYTDLLKESCKQINHPLSLEIIRSTVNFPKDYRNELIQSFINEGLCYYDDIFKKQSTIIDTLKEFEHIVDYKEFAYSGRLFEICNLNHLYDLSIYLYNYAPEPLEENQQIFLNSVLNSEFFEVIQYVLSKDDHVDHLIAEIFSKERNELLLQIISANLISVERFMNNITVQEKLEAIQNKEPVISDDDFNWFSRLCQNDIRIIDMVNKFKLYQQLDNANPHIDKKITTKKI